MDERIKILPALIVTAGLLLGLKVLQIVTGFGPDPISPAVASAEPSAAKKPAAKAPEAHAEPGPPPAPARLPDAGVSVSPSELDVLESLGKRREEIDRRAADIDMKEKLLAATEKRIDEKIAKLQTIEARVQELLGQRDEVEEAQLQSLVKVYESMKPKEAAAIFETLDREILIAVVQRMKEARLAPILADMSPKTAQDVTVMLAQRGKSVGDALEAVKTGL